MRSSGFQVAHADDGFTNPLDFTQCFPAHGVSGGVLRQTLRQSRDRHPQQPVAREELPDLRWGRHAEQPGVNPRLGIVSRRSFLSEKMRMAAGIDQALRIAPLQMVEVGIGVGA